MQNIPLLIEPIREDLTKKKSPYQEKDKAVVERYLDIYEDYGTADLVRKEPYEEFNDRDLVQFMNDNQRAFNSYVPYPEDNDPDEDWRANTVNGMTRNKAIAIAAHVTGQLLYPNTIAQNDKDEEDEAAALVMRDMMKFSFDESEYEKKMVLGVISAMYNPRLIVQDDYADVKRKIKVIQPDGSWKEEIVQDDLYSGFKLHIIQPEEFYIANAYEPTIQKQPFIIVRRFLNYNTAKLLYGGMDNWKYITPGVRSFYSREEVMFYEETAESLRSHQVEEVTYYNRYADLEIRLVNGIMMDDPDRPMQRADKKYPFAGLYNEPISENFFYGKPLTEKLALEQSSIDTIYNLLIDAAHLQTMPPALVFGNEEFTSAVAVPGKITPVGDVNARFEQVQSGNMAPAANLLQILKQNASESSSDPLMSGQTPSGTATAFEISVIQQNAQRVLGLFGKMVKFFVEELGELRMNTILQHFAIADASKLLTDKQNIMYRSLLVDRQERGEKKVRIEFNTDMPITEEGLEERENELLTLEETTGYEHKIVHPSRFRELKFSVRVEADLLFSSSEMVQKGLNLEAYDRAINNPLLDQQMVVKKFLLSNYVKGEEDDYIAEAPMGQQGAEGQDAGLVDTINKSLTTQTGQV